MKVLRLKTSKKAALKTQPEAHSEQVWLIGWHILNEFLNHYITFLCKLEMLCGFPKIPAWQEFAAAMSRGSLTWMRHFWMDGWSVDSQNAEDHEPFSGHLYGGSARNFARALTEVSIIWGFLREKLPAHN